MLTPPEWQVTVDVIRIVEVLGCLPLLFFSAARIFQSPSWAQRALGLSSVLFIITAGYGLLDNLGRPATLRVGLVLIGVIAGLWGGWRFYRGTTLREPRRQTRERLRDDPNSAAW